MQRFATLMLAAALVTLAAPLAAPAAEARHSGRIVAIDPRLGTVRFEEMLAWTGPDTGTVERTVKLTPDTTVQSVSRAALGPDQWPNAWEAQPIAPAALKPGDFVTVTTRTEAADVATTLEVVRPEP